MDDDQEMLLSMFLVLLHWHFDMSYLKYRSMIIYILLNFIVIFASAHKSKFPIIAQLLFLLFFANAQH